MEVKKMDYKEPIKNLRKVASCLQEDDAPKCATVCENAIAAIETLLAELEAAIIDAEFGYCLTCKYKNEERTGVHCIRCRNCEGEQHMWQWRGPTPSDCESTKVI